MLTLTAEGALFKSCELGEILASLHHMTADVPALITVFSEESEVAGVLIMMRLENTPASELLSVLAAAATRFSATEGLCVSNDHRFPLERLRTQKWPVGLDPVRDEARQEVLRFRVGRHHSASLQASR